MKEWWSAKLENDPRWIAGTPPQGNANFAWLQHMLYHGPYRQHGAAVGQWFDELRNTNNEAKSVRS